MAEIIKKIEKYFIKTLKQLSNQNLNMDWVSNFDFQNENVCEPEQLEAEVKNEVVYKIKRVSEKLSEVGAKRVNLG